MLKAKGLRPYSDRRMIINARTGRLSLLSPRVNRAETQEGSFASYISRLGCPCGEGPQTMRHLQRRAVPPLPKNVERGGGE